MKMTLQERLEARSIPEPMSGCYLWTGPTRRGRTPYGYLSYEGRTLYAHRASYAVAFGEIPPGMLVCHKCDNHACINPDHLFLGTFADNSADMVHKGRSQTGTRNTAAKLTPEIVIYIRSCGLPSEPLARQFGVHYTAIDQIKRRQTWKTVL